MLYRATHTTRYFYEHPVTESRSEARLAPRNHPRQRVQSSTLTIDPAPTTQSSRTDYFGNTVLDFSILQPHTVFTATATSLVEVLPRTDEPLPDMAWEDARDRIHRAEDDDTLAACEFREDSPFVPQVAELAAFAAESFTPHRSLTDALIELNTRIYQAFQYTPNATTIDMPLAEVFRLRRGVCQDYAHAMIAALRSLRLPARYVSGYLRSGDAFIGSEASHAWLAAYVPDYGWLDLDPTNNLLPSDGHVTLAWGRDYGDVTPLKGIAFGGGAQIIDVDVRVKPV